VLVKRKLRELRNRRFENLIQQFRNLFQKMFPYMRTVSGFLGTINSDIFCTELLASYESTTSLCFLDKLTMQLSHLPHVLVAIRHTVLAFISLNSPKVSMRSLKSDIGKKRTFPTGKSYFGLALRQTHLKTAIFVRDRASFIATNLAIEYIEYIEYKSSLAEASLVRT
jgi:hypothetical protein